MPPLLSPLNFLFQNRLGIDSLNHLTFDFKGVLLARQKAKIGERLISMAAVRGIYHPPIVPIFGGIFSGDLDNTSSKLLSIIANFH